ncbi:MAG: glycerate kinase [Acidimicrobiales bacterium]
MPRLLAAPDKYRGTATAAEVAAALVRAGRRRGWEAEAQPLSDGGDGLLDVFAVRQLEARFEPVCGPLGHEVVAEWRTDGELAVIEMARASGLSLVGGSNGNDAVAATSVGTGQLIAAAADAVGGGGGGGDGDGGGRIIVGLGGSASTDGGWEASAAVRSRGGLHGVRLVGACDVYIGFVEAARLFAPQKGASVEQVELLEARLELLVRRYREEFGADVASVPGAGAAGGFGGAIVAMGGELRSGYELVAESIDLRRALAAADLVVTGEGALDEQSFLGKVVGGVIDDAEVQGVPVIVVAGRATSQAKLEASRRGVRVVSLIDRFGRSRAMSEPVSCIEEVAVELLVEHERGG